MFPQPVPVNERGLHVYGLVSGLGLGLRGAYVDADPTAGAVVHGHSDSHVVAWEILGAEGLGQKALRSTGDRFGREHFHAYDRVRAHDRALAAVDADVRVPDRHLHRNGPLLIASRAGRETAIHRQGRHR